MMSDNYLKRPTVNQLLKVEPIKSKLAERTYNERVNYYVSITIQVTFFLYVIIIFFLAKLV